jgi:hypothetical protein
MHNVCMTTTQGTPPGGWTDADRVPPTVSPKVMFAETAITVKRTPISGPARLYRLTRVADNGPFWTFGGVRVSKAGKVIGNGGTAYICDVAKTGRALRGTLEVV